MTKRKLPPIPAYLAAFISTFLSLFSRGIDPAYALGSALGGSFWAWGFSWCLWWVWCKSTRHTDKHEAELEAAVFWAAAAIARADNSQELTKEFQNWCITGRLMDSWGELSEQGTIDVPMKRSVALRKIKVLERILKEVQPNEPPQQQ